MERSDDHPSAPKKTGKQHNILPLWGNEATMNLNPLILANIQGSSYFKVHLFKLKTYHEVVDEIYYQVKHLEPWERGSRKTAGQTGMCGGVRGVGAGGIVSTAFCLLYKLYTLRLTRKQVNGLLSHTDSPYIRALGFMYIRYTQPPGDLYDWYEDYMLDPEEIDVKAGGGQTITIGQMCYQFLTKLDWFSTLFPRIPVPIQKQIEKKLDIFSKQNNVDFHRMQANAAPSRSSGGGREEFDRSSRYSGNNKNSQVYYTNKESELERSRERERYNNRDVDKGRREDREREREDRDRDRDRDRDYYYEKKESKHERSRSRSPNDRHDNREKHKKHKHKDRYRENSRDRSDEYYRESREKERHYSSYKDYEKKYR